MLYSPQPASIQYPQYRFAAGCTTLTKRVGVSCKQMTNELAFSHVQVAQGTFFVVEEVGIRGQYRDLSCRGGWLNNNAMVMFDW